MCYTVCFLDYSHYCSALLLRTQVKNAIGTSPDVLVLKPQFLFQYLRRCYCLYTHFTPSLLFTIIFFAILWLAVNLWHFNTEESFCNFFCNSYGEPLNLQLQKLQAIHMIYNWHVHILEYNKALPTVSRSWEGTRVLYCNIVRMKKWSILTMEFDHCCLDNWPLHVYIYSVWPQL